MTADMMLGAVNKSITVSQLHPTFESKSIEMMLLCHLCLFYDQLTQFFFSPDRGVYWYNLYGVPQELCSTVSWRGNERPNNALAADIQIICTC